MNQLNHKSNREHTPHQYLLVRFASYQKLPLPARKTTLRDRLDHILDASQPPGNLLFEATSDVKQPLTEKLW